VSISDGIAISFGIASTVLALVGIKVALRRAAEKKGSFSPYLSYLQGYSFYKDSADMCM
jgi:hypothetical protein